jgi:hypothetical protein
LKNNSALPAQGLKHTAYFYVSAFGTTEVVPYPRSSAPVGGDPQKSGPSPGQTFFAFIADLIAGSPNETHSAITAATQMYHGIWS